MIGADHIERARAVRIENEIARRGIKLKRAGVELFGACPVCGGTDRFALHTKKQVFNCRGCTAKGDVIALVQHLDGSDFATAIATLAGNTAMAAPQAKPAPAQRDGRDEDDQRRLEQADAIWRTSSPLGPDAITYFARRGINIHSVPDHGGLRYLPHCPWQGGTTPAIVGHFTTALNNESRGIWRRPLTGEKPKSLGPMAGCVIRLWPDEAVEQGLVVGEGVETTLAAATRITHRGTLLQPAWAMCFAGNIRHFPVLTGIEALTILVDHDHADAHGRRAGQEAAAACAARWSEAGREVIRLTPKIVGADFNDVVIHE
jgi:phage/plasmid primase-like uncharacterized protein